MRAVLFTFDTTHMALWAEEVAGAAGITVEVMPTPPGTGALCNLALAAAMSDREALAGILESAGVVFREPVPLEV